MVYPVENRVRNIGIRVSAAQHAPKLTLAKTHTYCFHMKKPNVLIACAAAFSLNACGSPVRHDPNGPASHVNVGVPDWAQTLPVDVRSRAASVRVNGEWVSVAKITTDVGGGITANRERDALYVSDASGVKCRWGISDKTPLCLVPNPAYGAYLNAKANLRF